jgi:hypothetical protein
LCSWMTNGPSNPFSTPTRHARSHRCAPSFQGRYRVIRPSTVVQGAYDADFGFMRKRLTLYADALLAEANRSACGKRTWTRGREEDVSVTGCLWVVPVSACPQEFDLVKIDDGRLLLGERPAVGQDLCREDRPRALRLLPLVRWR